jgi:hypothetical protein
MFRAGARPPPLAGIPARHVHTVFSAAPPQHFVSSRLEDGSIRVRHPAVPAAAPNPQHRLDLANPPALATALTPEQVSEAKQLREADPFGWSQAALAR